MKNKDREDCKFYDGDSGCNLKITNWCAPWRGCVCFEDKILEVNYETNI